MRDWTTIIIGALKATVLGDPFWEPCVNSILNGSYILGIHIAILVDPYLKFILEGKKTVESRFSVHRFPPFGYVERGDIILLKKSGGPIIGLSQVTEVWYYQLKPESWEKIRNEFAQMLCAQDPDFWTNRQKASFATLMRLGNVREIEPIKISKVDRRGWVVLRVNSKQPKLPTL